MIRTDIKENVGQYLSELMNAELTHFLGRGPYERGAVQVNYRNVSYPRKLTLKGVGSVNVKVPQDRNGKFHTRMIPKASLTKMRCARVKV